MPKRFGLCCALLALSTSALAQSRGPAARLESTLWDHDGSVVYLLALGAARELHYKEPRAGMVEAGARPGALLFRGTVANGQFVGTAFIFDRRCGPLPYPVSGPILDHDERVVLTGEAPLVGAKCRVQGHFTEVLEFRLQNANKTARALAPEDAPSPPLPTEERPALPAPAPPAPSRESQSPSPTPPAVAADAARAPKAAAAPPPPPAAQNAPVVVADAAPVPKAAAAPPPPPPPPAAQTPPAVVADAAPAPKVVAAPPPRSSTPAPDLAGEIERTRAARQQAAAAAEAAHAAELAAHRASAEAEAARAAAEAHTQQSRDELRAAREENSEERSRQYLILILAAMSWTLLLSGAAIVLLFAWLRRSQSPRKTEDPKTEDASAATMTRSSVYSRFSESIAQADAASAAKSHGYQSGGRVRVFFQTRASNPSGNSSALRRVGYAPR
jgi:hypothetical protein